MGILLRGGRVIDPANGIDGMLDVLVLNGKIAAVAEDLKPAEDCDTLDCTGCWVVPGLIDLHVHLREPGQQHKETILTGSKSAAAGGFTTICAMPNTSPVIDSAELVKQVKGSDAAVTVLPVGCLTKGQHGGEPVDFGAMLAAGACAFSEDGKSVANGEMMLKVLRLAAEASAVVFDHCEEASLAKSGVINEGAVSERLGLRGISNESEYAIVSRDIKLAEKTGARLHICHMSVSESVHLLREAKRRGLPVTGEAAPHHFTLCDEDVDADDGNFKMNPPLRSKKDVQAILDGLKDGTIDVIATDHAPHTADEKAGGFEKAANGIVGLETAVGLSVTELVSKGVLSPPEFIAMLATNPAKILGIDRGTLGIGKAADITVIDPDTRWTVEPNRFYSKGRNTPFGGRTLKGRAVLTIVGGKIVWRHEGF